jgi:hypothetical protein
VEHAATPFEAVRPWRTAAIVASAVAALELIVLIVAGVILIGRPLAHGATSRSKAKPRPAKAAKPKPERTALRPRTRTPVLVLNGNGQAGAAHAEAARVTARGYPISAVGNAVTPNHGPSLVMYRPGREREARRLARDLRIRLVAPLDGLPLGSLHGAQVAIVLGY